jgi:predicted DNA-binding transcriptional regulator YafY
VKREEIAGVLGEAIALDAPVWIVYTKPGEASAARRVEPLELHRNQETHEPFVLAIEDQKGYRNFRLDRIESASLA